MIVATVWESLLSFEARHGGFAPGFVPGEGAADLGLEASNARAVALAGRDLTREAGMNAVAVSRQGVGPIWETLVQIADSVRPMVIVVGSRGLTGVRSVLLGSVSRQLVERAHYPVLVIPGEEPRFSGPGGSGARDAVRTDAGPLSPVPPSGHRGRITAADADTSVTATLADRLIAAWQSSDVEGLVNLFTPDGTLEIRGEATAVGTASIRREATAYFGEPKKIELRRWATTLHPNAATLTLDITLSRANGTSVGPLIATVRLNRDGPRLSYVEISDFNGAEIPD